jgi:hypothetical protein
MADLTSSQLSALRSLYELTRGRCRPSDLAGPANKHFRASMLARLRGVSKVPLAAANLTDFCSAFYALAGTDGALAGATCLADRWSLFSSWAMAQLNKVSL